MSQQSSADIASSPAPVTVPSTLSSPRSKLVYLYLGAVGDASRTELQHRLDLTGLTLLSVLRQLQSQGLVDQDPDGGWYRLAGVTSP